MPIPSSLSLPLLLSLAAAGSGDLEPSLVAGLEVSPQETIELGIVGVDTKDVVTLTELLNDPNAAEDVAGCRVVAAFPAGSRVPENLEHRQELTAALERLGVEVAGSVAELVERVDGVLITANDGRPHLEQAAFVMKAGKPVFVRAPLAATLEEAFAIAGLAERLKVPCFTSSLSRLHPTALAARDGRFGEVIGAATYGPAELERNHSDLFWQGTSGVELLCTAMGPGCERVACTSSARTDVVVGTWPEERLGTFRGIRSGKRETGGTVFGHEAITALGPFEDLRPLAVELVRFFRTGEARVSTAESLEPYTFMEAAAESKRRDGAAVTLEEVEQAAREKAAKVLEKLVR